MRLTIGQGESAPYGLKISRPLSSNISKKVSFLGYNSTSAKALPSTMRRKLNVFLACLLLTTVSILVGYKHFAGDSPFRIDSVFDNGWFSSSSSNSANSTGKLP